MKAWSKNEIVELRNPNSTRPWQHVLEPLSGYLKLASALYFDKSLNGEAFNFGPQFSNNYSVKELVEKMNVYWPSGKINIPSNITSDSNLYEAGLLKLNIDKAITELSWHPTLSFEETAKWTSEWYKSYYDQSIEEAKNTTITQIENYMNLAVSRKSFSFK